MGNERLFVLQVIVAVENQWLSNGREQPPTRTMRQYRVEDLLYSAVDEEAAFRMADDWMANGAFSDRNHDGPGDFTLMFAIGIHELSEIVNANEVVAKAKELYGIVLPGFWLGDIDANGVPTVRSKKDLEVFRNRRNTCT
jgi:hypothetical protein